MLAWQRVVICSFDCTWKFTFFAQARLSAESNKACKIELCQGVKPISTSVGSSQLQKWVFRIPLVAGTSSNLPGAKNNQQGRRPTLLYALRDAKRWDMSYWKRNSEQTSGFMCQTSVERVRSMWPINVGNHCWPSLLTIINQLQKHPGLSWLLTSLTQNFRVFLIDDAGRD